MLPALDRMRLDGNTSDKITLDKIMAKLTEEEQYHLGKLISTDELTGAKNRRAFEDDAERELHRGNRSDYDISLLMIDVDGFKQYNDKYGHPEGDKKLKEIVGIIRLQLRDYDGIYRLGGDEFSVILPNTIIEEGYNIAERLRKATEENAGMTISIGLSNYGETSKNLYDLIKHSDEALYKSKREGRNKTTVYTMLVEEPDEQIQILKAAV